MKKNKLIISTLLCFSLAVSVALYLCIFPSPKTYDVSLQEIVASQSQENVQLIDLRTQSEVQKTGLIPGAIHIDYYSSSFREQLGELNTNKEYIIYCHSGVRSAKTIALMSKLGLTQVRDYSPGIQGWLAGGGETEIYK